MPPFYVVAESHGQAADRAFEIVFAARPGATGATVHAGVEDRAGACQAVEVTITG